MTQRGGWHQACCGNRNLPSDFPLPEPWFKPGYATCADVIHIRAAPFSSNKGECERGIETGRCGKSVPHPCGSKCVRMCVVSGNSCPALNSTLSVRPAAGSGPDAHRAGVHQHHRTTAHADPWFVILAWFHKTAHACFEVHVREDQMNSLGGSLNCTVTIHLALQ